MTVEAQVVGIEGLRWVLWPLPEYLIIKGKEHKITKAALVFEIRPRPLVIIHVEGISEEPKREEREADQSRVDTGRRRRKRRNQLS